VQYADQMHCTNITYSWVSVAEWLAHLTAV